MHYDPGVIRSLLLAVSLAVSLAVAGARGTPPNIVLIVGDDLTYHDLGVFGNSDVKTPHLDRLAGEGMRLTHLFTPAPMCAPTRMSLYTGLYPVRNGGHPNHSRVKDGVRSLPHYLQPLGYRVALLGKRHIQPPESFPFEFLGGRQHDGGNGKDIDVDAVGKFLGGVDGPFCLVLASNQPHTPWNRGDASAYDPAALALPPYLVDTPETRAGLARYYAEITYLDDQVGRTLELLEASGHADDTLVMFVTEQGSNFPHCKWTLYDTGVRASGIVRLPGTVKPGSRSDQLLSYVDVLPTLIDLAGGDPAAGDFDGVSFASILRGDDAPLHEQVFSVQTSRGIYSGPEHYGIRAARGKRYKYIRNLTPETPFQNTVTENWPIFAAWRRAAAQGDEHAARLVHAYQHRPAEELYDLAADPFELTNIVDDPANADVLAELRAATEAWMHQQGDEGQATEMNALNRQPGR